MRNILFLSLLLLSMLLRAQIIVPTPAKLDLKNGDCLLRRNELVVSADSVALGACSLFAETLFEGEECNFTTDSLSARLLFRVDAFLPSEGYRLLVDEQCVRVYASDYPGFVYAVQSLRQLAQMRGDGSVTFPCVEVCDSPRLVWRSFMLDSGRQYQSVATIKKYIDMLSMLKMNYFHWHLTEGLGWRLQIKSYSMLTEKGAFVASGDEQQGFYTQEEVRDIVNYARRRAVTIVPEIDFPGHAEAALTAYPQFSCFGEPIGIPREGFTENIFCAGKDSVLIFLRDVLDEVCQLFPSQYIHLGGDEAPKDNWDACPDCSRRVASLGLGDSHNLQRWLSAQMASYLASKGRKAIFWEDVIVHDGYPLPSNVIILWWNYRTRGDAALKDARRNNYPVIANTNYYTYLNFPTSPWRGYTKERTFDVETLYNENPSYKASLHYNNIIGIGCSLWCDYGLTENMLDERLFPRIFVLAQQMWGSSSPSFSEFGENIKSIMNFFSVAGYSKKSNDAQ
ncbi:MAG: beta-N-acetylhexosaminidase [Bacteroidaceae bacterium]|nr:beta-N-acetylhexosaminidase [Bacteroidaceae bacterium]